MHICIRIHSIYTGVHGHLKRTEKGELSIIVLRWAVLTKSLSPLPDKFHGLQDTNKRYRNRHLDMIVNKSVKDTLIKRARIVSSIRRALDEQGYVEVETPILQTEPGGADGE